MVHNNKLCKPTRLSRVLRLARRVLPLGCACALSIVAQSPVRADSDFDVTAGAERDIGGSGGELLNLSRPAAPTLWDDLVQGVDMRADEGSQGDGASSFSGVRGRFLWNLNFSAPEPLLEGDTDLAYQVRTADAMPVAIPGSGESWSLSAGLSLGDPAESAVVFAGLGYSPRLRSLQTDELTPGRLVEDTALGDSVQYGFGLAAPLTSRMNIGLSYTQRYAERNGIDPGAGEMPSNAWDGDRALDIGLSYGSRDHMRWTTSLKASMGEDARTPDVVFSVKFPCCL